MFRTELHIAPSNNKISLEIPILTIGSCFSSHIGNLLSRFRFNVCANPFGTLFNPISIHRLLSYAQGNPVAPEGYLLQGENHFHYDFHSSFSGLEKRILKEKIENTIATTSTHLETAKWLILTWGTAIIYERKDNGVVVSNCHKVPAGQFNKRLLTQKEIIADFERTISRFPEDIQVLITVSPVRHIKDSPELNNVSKSTLRLASHTLVSHHKNVHYFPAYEIMMDDLRDYRFYKPDMVHPSDTAIEYIWNKFAHAYFDVETMNFIEEWGKLLQAMEHKPFRSGSQQYHTFVQSTIDKLNTMATKVDVSQEIRQLQMKLK